MPASRPKVKDERRQRSRSRRIEKLFVRATETIKGGLIVLTRTKVGARVRAVSASISLAIVHLLAGSDWTLAKRQQSTISRVRKYRPDESAASGARTREAAAVESVGGELSEHGLD